jgi:hypothetical protein
MAKLGTVKWWKLHGDVRKGIASGRFILFPCKGLAQQIMEVYFRSSIGFVSTDP